MSIDLQAKKPEWFFNGAYETLIRLGLERESMGKLDLL